MPSDVKPEHAVWVDALRAVEAERDAERARAEVAERERDTFHGDRDNWRDTARRYADERDEARRERDVYRAVVEAAERVFARWRSDEDMGEAMVALKAVIIDARRPAPRPAGEA